MAALNPRDYLAGFKAGAGDAYGLMVLCSVTELDGGKIEFLAKWRDLEIAHLCGIHPLDGETPEQVGYQAGAGLAEWFSEPIARARSEEKAKKNSAGEIRFPVDPELVE